MSKIPAGRKREKNYKNREKGYISFINHSFNEVFNFVNKSLKRYETSEHYFLISTIFFEIT